MSRDSTEIEAREKPLPRKKDPKKKGRHKRGRPKKGEKRAQKEPSVLEKQVLMSYDELMNSFSTGCDVGCKKKQQREHRAVDWLQTSLGCCGWGHPRYLTPIFSLRS